MFRVLLRANLSFKSGARAIAPLPRISAAASLSSHSVRLLSSKKSDLASTAATHPIFTREEVENAKRQRLTALGPYVSRLPEKWIPYAELMRLEKPGGTWLLFLPSSWAILIAAFELSAPVTQTASVLGLFAIGSVLMRGAGCTINDILDEKFDKKVIRTIERPVASGRVSKESAYKFLAAQTALGGLVLLSLPLDCFLLGASSLFLVFTYPLFKRFTYYPQTVLSACFNWGTMLGFAAMGDWNWSLMLPLYFATFNWCVAYDTIYAHQDKEYDVKAGVKSTALAWGENTKRNCYALATVQTVSFAAVGLLGSLGPGYFLGSAALCLNFFKIIRTTRLDSIPDCWRAFNSNVNSAKWLTVGVLLDYILRLLGFI